ncbi:MAG: Ig-like domain-containing protein [Eubacterium sp.]|nr:Ig-like domain-containing protein [Eubacterium sp.]
MLCFAKRCMTVFVAVMLVLAEPLLTVGPAGLYSGSGTAYASVGSVADGSDVIYDKTGGILSSLGFDTTKLPDTYDPNATTNPYGSDVSTLNEVKELAILDTSNTQQGGVSELFGHNKPLNGSFETFKNNPIVKNIRKNDDPHKMQEGAFMSAVKCDINGDGRDSALAIVYTNYSTEKAQAIYNNSALSEQQKKAQLQELQSVFLRLYNPAEGIMSDAIKIAEFNNTDNQHLVYFDYFLQSQMQITAGDYDKDSVDEIAVYVPSGTEKVRNKVTIFDLTDGTECENPYSVASWREAWNYVLPVSESEVVNFSNNGTIKCVRNVYNNLDLTSGDADNDGICDLVVSYGASETDNYLHGTISLSPVIIKRSVPSTSVLLYGRDTGQMLRDEQVLSYDDNDLIRVSFAFGDVDGDGNEDMFIGGQLQSESNRNETRILGKYIYDTDSDSMEVESIQDVKVVEGDYDSNDRFYSTNGWNQAYFSTPLMKTNLAIGKFMGEASSTRIYMDSVLYSYENGQYEIIDELEDSSELKDDEGNSYNPKKYKGSRVFTDIKKEFPGFYDMQCWYYEYGADSGDFTGSLSDYLIVSRVSVDKEKGETQASRQYVTDARYSLLYLNNKNELTKYEMNPLNGYQYHSMTQSAPRFVTTTDTDIDSMVATYTGIHNIVYQEPKVMAVLTAAPYFKDVADFTGGSLASGCSTTYGETDGTISGDSHSFNYNVGAFLNVNFGIKLIYMTVKTTGGYARNESWGNTDTTAFKMSYKTGGEDSVVLYSIPTENYEYVLEGISVDDDGNFKKCTQPLIVARPHKPVTQTIALDDYIDIQKRSKNKIPDVTKYFKSTPGDPSSYPKSQNDLTKEAKEKLGEVKTFKQFAGVAYGSGNVTQTITFTHNYTHTLLKGGYFSINAGIGGTRGGTLPTDIFFTGEGGLNFSFTKNKGTTDGTTSGSDCSGTVPNMPKAAKGYGYDFSWKLLKYEIKTDAKNSFYVITYIVDDVSAPPKLPDSIQQDFDNTTDSQIALTWTQTQGDPKEFDIYRYEDFPQGGGDKLVGTVDGSDYKLMKDENGHTIVDDKGRPIRHYSFIEEGLTADARYSYRLKVKGDGIPPESIFSPVVEARTFVKTMPDISLSTDKLTIYPDSVYLVETRLADPENYQSDINYQWQKYNQKTRQWEDLDGCTRKNLCFYSCSPDDEGQYRCRMNLVRSIESNPQYISAYTETCTVTYSLRSVKFGDIKVTEVRDNQGNITDTGLSVTVSNDNPTSKEKPAGKMEFTFKGPNGILTFEADIDEATGKAEIESIEDLIGTAGAEAMVDGGYLITVRYEGNKIFYPADDPEEYHYLRNIEECIFLSTKSAYYFGEDVMETVELSDYQKGGNGKIKKTDLTDKLTKLEFYEAIVNGDEITKGELVETYDITSGDKKAPVPLDKKLAKHAYIEAYTDGDEPVAHSYIDTMKVEVQISLNEKLTGTGNMLKWIDASDVTVSNDIELEKKNIKTADGDKSLMDFLLFKYYEQNGDYICNSDNAEQHKNEFIPAAYHTDVSFIEAESGEDESKKYASYFYTPTFSGADFIVVGNYYLVSAGPADINTGSVKMISPDDLTDFTDKGYAGGTKLQLQAVPNKGYEISKWLVTEPVKDGTTKTYTLPGDETITYTVKSENEEADVEGDGKITILAVMKPKENRLTFSKIGKGSLALKPSGIESGDIVLADTKLEFTATPDAGWRFEEWRWTNIGGNNIVSGGVTDDEGVNRKTFTMPDNSAELYAIFARDTIDIITSNDFDVLYINDGSNPYYDDGELVMTERGKDVPKGVEVIVRAKPGIVFTPGSEWDVKETTVSEEIKTLTVTEVTSDGRPGCRFKLDDDAISCIVARDAEKGKYAVNTSGTGIEFTVTVDGEEMSGNPVYDIEAGSLVSVKAKPVRGELIKSWTVNGTTNESSEGTYSFNITENMNISVQTKDDEKLELKLSTTGGGTAVCKITDKNGDNVDPVEFSGAEQTVDAYKGEEVLIGAADGEDEYTLNAVIVNDEQLDLDEDGKVTLKDLDEDKTIVCRFGASTYVDATFTKDVRKIEKSDMIILSEDETEIDDGESYIIQKGQQFEFTVSVPETSNSYVTVDGEPLDASGDPITADGRKTYSYKIASMNKDKEVAVCDYRVIYIPDEKDTRTPQEQLIAYFEMITDSVDNQPDGVLTDDITLEGNYSLPRPKSFSAVFDGKGHTITGMKIKSAYGDGRVIPFSGLFGNVKEGACIRDVALSGLDVAAMGDIMGGIYVSSKQTGLICKTNSGTISGVAIIDSVLDVTDASSSERNKPLAGIAFENNGTIENCLVRGLSVTTDADAANTVMAGVVNNYTIVGDQKVGGQIKNSYFAGFGVKYAGQSDFSYPTDNVIARVTDNPVGTFEGNYYNATYNGNDQFGTSVFTLASSTGQQAQEEEVKTPAFTRKLAYTMNGSTDDPVWGTTDPADDTSADDPESARMIQIKLGGEKCKAPIKVSYEADGHHLDTYLYPGDNKLPPADVFDGVTVTAWEIDDKAYAPGDTVELDEDMSIVGIVDLSDYVASLELTSDGDAKPIIYYTDIKEAFRAAEANEAAAEDSVISQVLTIIGTCTLADESVSVGANTTLIIKEDVAFTMNGNTYIENSGVIEVEQGATVHKYGTMRNKANASISIPEGSGTPGAADGKYFYNYGTLLENNGVIDHPEYIKCVPHLCEEWKYADEPDEEGKWWKTSKCSVCGTTVKEEIKPNPPAAKVKRIEIFHEAEKIVYEINDNFTKSGLVIVAVLTDDTKAPVTDYTLALKVGDEEEKPLKENDALTEQGAAKVIVKYGKFTCDYDITISNTADLLTLTDAEGNEITEADMAPEQKITINASLKEKLPYETEFKWAVDDSDVASLDTKTTGKTKEVTAGQLGEAIITVTVVDKDGIKIQDIDPKTVHVEVKKHLTSLKIKGDDLTVNKDDNLQLELETAPEGFVDTIEWTSSDEDTAAVDQNGLISGKKGGDVTITVTSSNGLTDSKKVTVLEPANDLTIDPTTLNTVIGSYSTINAVVSNENANAEITWTIDQNTVGGFYVKNETTGAMEVVDTAKTKLTPDGKGKATAYITVFGQAEGDAVITASVQGAAGTIEKTCSLTVSPSNEFINITLNGTSISGQTLKMSLSGQYVKLGAISSHTGDTFKWEVIDDSADPVLEVDSTGIVTFRKVGTAAVKATSQYNTSLSDVVMIKVIAEPTGVIVTPSKLELKEGTQATLTAKLIPEGAEGKVKWSSSDTKVATVTDSGVVKAVSKGTAIITAQPEAEGAESATCEVTVTGGSGPVPPGPGPGPEPEPDKLITVSREKMDLRIGGNDVLFATVKDVGPDAVVVWTVDNDKAAGFLVYDEESGLMKTVSTVRTQLIYNEYDKLEANVILTGIGNGTANVTAEVFTKNDANSGSSEVLTKDTCVLTVGEVDSYVYITHNGAPVSGQVMKMSVEDKIQLGAESSESTDSFKWTSISYGDDEVLKTSNSGRVTMLDEGFAAVRVMSRITGAADICFFKVTEAVIPPEPVISDLDVTLDEYTFIYDGTKKLPAVTVKNGDKVLGDGIKESNDNVILLTDDETSTMPGIYKVVAIARDIHMGSGEARYTIIVKPTAIKKLKKGSRSFKVKWKKVSKKNITGYQIRYSTKKSMKRSKYKTVKKYNKTSLTVKKLKARKKYYVQVRTYVKKNGITYWSQWSKKKSVRTKK